MLVCRVEGHSVSSLFALIPRGCHLQYLGFCSLLQHHVACRLVGATLKTSCVQCVCDVEFPMLMFGVIMSGDTWEQVCVLQKRRLHEVNVKFIFFMMKRCRQCALMFGFCNPRRSFGKRAHRGAVLRQVWRGDGAAMVICLDEPILFRVP